MPVCVACGHAVFPPRALCPRCGGADWRSTAAGRAIVENTTERDGVRIGVVLSERGPRVVARLDGAVEPGDVVLLDGRDGVPVASG